MKIVKLLVVLGIIGMTGILGGCQADIIGPSVTAKLLYEGENGGNEWKSRNSGMATQSGYSFSIGNFGTNQFVSPKQQ